MVPATYSRPRRRRHMRTASDFFAAALADGTSRSRQRGDRLHDDALAVAASPVRHDRGGDPSPAHGGVGDRSEVSVPTAAGPARSAVRSSGAPRSKVDDRILRSRSARRHDTPEVEDAPLVEHRDALGDAGAAFASSRRTCGVDETLIVAVRHMAVEPRLQDGGSMPIDAVLGDAGDSASDGRPALQRPDLDDAADRPRRGSMPETWCVRPSMPSITSVRVRPTRRTNVCR